MPIQKKFVMTEMKVFPSNENTIEVFPQDGYEGAHRYRVQLCAGFEDGKTKYVDKTDTIQFVQKHDDGTVTPGFQSEQLALILLDRVCKLNERFPCAQNEKQIKGLQMYLEACRERVQERIDRGVMGQLKK
nr:MAG TPA: hypothetical protein [Caudoviricetes sp.]